MEDFIYDYYLKPILDHSGYNIVNTLTYAVIALLAIYGIYRIFRNKKIEIDNNFLYGVLAFVLFGSTMRTVTDAVDRGILTGVSPLHEFVLNSHIYDYGYFTVSPMIYIVTAAIFLSTFFILRRMGKERYLAHVGIILFLLHFIIILPFLGYAVYIIAILVLAVIPTYLAYIYFKKQLLYALMVAAHSIDGAATFFVIDIFSKISGIRYFEQHVVGSTICNAFGTCFPFYLLKVAVAFIAAYVLMGEKMDDTERRFIALVIMIMGFAPGIRDILRMALGA